MAGYLVEFTKTGADSVQQLVEVLANATRPRRIKWVDFTVANVAATPLDAPFTFLVRRVTASATGTTVTPVPIDPADAATEATAEHLITADHASFASGTTQARKPCNGRATLRWSAVPGKEIVSPATASNGLSLGLSAVSTSIFSGDVTIEEQ